MSKAELKKQPCRIVIADKKIDFQKATPFSSGDMVALEDRTGIKLMGGGTTALDSVKKIVQFVHYFANIVDQTVREEDVAALPFDVLAHVARWLNTNGVRDIDDPNLLKQHTF
jgi:hypothetical protein